MLRSILLVAILALGSESYNIAVIYPDRSTKYYEPFATEAAEAFENSNEGSVKVLVTKRHFNSINMCAVLQTTVKNLLETDPSIHVFIISPGHKEVVCYDQWQGFSSRSVFLVTPDPIEIDKKVFWFMNGYKYRTSTWQEMVYNIAELHSEENGDVIQQKRKDTVTDDNPFKDVNAGDFNYIPTWDFNPFTTTTRASRILQSTTLSFREIRSKKYDDEQEERKQRRRVGMLLIGCGAVCTMAFAFYIRNRFCQLEDKANENDDKMDKAAIAEADAKTAKNWTAKEKSQKK